MVLTAQSEVRAFSFKFLSSVISTVSLYTVLIPWVTEGGGPVFKARQQERILSSFFCPSLQSSSEMTPKFAKIVPLEVTHLMLFGLSLSHAKAALLLPLTVAMCSALSVSDLVPSADLANPSNSITTVVGILMVHSPLLASSLRLSKLSTKMFVSGTRILGLMCRLTLTTSLSISLWAFLALACSFCLARSSSSFLSLNLPISLSVSLSLLFSSSSLPSPLPHLLLRC